MTDREHWEDRYASPERLHGDEPSEFLRANTEFLPRRGLALDIAAGEGRNSVFLASLGLQVVALDISMRALEKCLLLAHDKGASVEVAAVDLKQLVIPSNHFDVIVNFNYLERELAPKIVAGLRPGGLVVFETLTTDHLRWKPDFNPEYLLARGELPRMFHGLRLIKYRESDLETSTPEGQSRRSVASLIARKD